MAQWAEGFVNADTVGLDVSPRSRAPCGQPLFHFDCCVSCPPVIRVIPGTSYTDIPSIFPDASWTFCIQLCFFCIAKTALRQSQECSRLLAEAAVEVAEASQQGGGIGCHVSQ